MKGRRLAIAGACLLGPVAAGVIVWWAVRSAEPALVRFEPRLPATLGRTEAPLYPLQSVSEPNDPIERLFAVQVRIEGRAGLFLLDTGASVVTVSERFVRAIGVGERRAVPLETRFGVEQLDVFRAASFQVGQMVYRDFDVLILPLQHIQDWTHTDLDGIVGGNVLNAVPYRLDPVARRLVIDPAIRLAEAESVAVSFQEGLLVVAAKVNGGQVDFILDTGASHSLVRKEALETVFGSEPPPVRVERTRVVDIKNDRVIERETVTLPGVRIGDAAVGPLDAGLFEANLLGQDFLGRFVLTVDGPRGRLALRPAGER